MKAVITVTAVYDLPDNAKITEVEQDGVSYGQHIEINGHKLQPVIEFLEYEGKVEDSHSWGEPKEELDEVYENIETEEYTIIPLDSDEEE
ncbi:hypothetical protein QA601_06515 [Chitinispirillales bacterium ANBcel5]|uniref:hypothetical protein n=1 Tax=Cellulosispirillum alkaliphilum TaxID=3039283 RepID=UPI002A53C799|nr:hypothetical protein [Chitinispirillales bacterium ANBcel5]